MNAEPISLQIFVHVFNVILILIAITTISIVISRPAYKPFAIWVIPVAILLVVSLAYQAVALWDLLDGINLDSTIYDLWSDVIHSVDKITIVIYGWTLISLDRKNKKAQTKTDDLLNWKPFEKKDIS